MVLILAMFLGLSIPLALSENNKLSVDYVFELVGGDEFSGCGYWTIEDTQLLNIPGAPLVPYRAASILLPQGTQLKDVRIKEGKPIVQSGFDLPWGQPPCTFSDTPVIAGGDEAIYGSDDLYPNKLFDIVEMEYCKGFAILNLLLYPIQYQPKSGTIHFYERLTVEVQTSKGTKNSLYRGLADDKADIADFIDNPEVLTTYEDGPAPLATEEYIIITNDTMQSTFQALANYKAGYVNGAYVYTVSWINSNYSGTDTQMKMRNFIIDKYTNNGTKYVLLGGDVAAVPYRGFYVSTGGYTDDDMLADMYFGHLDGSHNSDGDSRYGETNDGVDFYAEVAVGRAPCQTVTEAQNFVNKVIVYECMTKPKRVLLHQSRVQPGNSPDSRCLAYSCDDYVPGDYYIDYLFEENGSITKDDWIEHWGYNPLVVAHMGIGLDPTCYVINYSSQVTWCCSDVGLLTNTFFPWTTSVACLVGQIEYDDCLAECYVMDPDNGAIAAIYNDNYGWFSTSNACMYSGEFCINEFRALFSDEKEKLGDMLNKARSYLASSAQSNSTYRWCFYERNLIGDPESPCLTERNGNCDTVTITYPSNGATVDGTVNITVSTQGCIHTVEFYIGGILKHTDTTFPFSYSWDTTRCPDGNYTIEVKGYCSGIYQDNDIITVTVDNDGYVTITNPEDGSTVSCTVQITTWVSEEVTAVKFYIDENQYRIVNQAPFECPWDTCKYSNGPHTIKAVAYAEQSLTGSDGVLDVPVGYDEVTVEVDNPCIGIVGPQDGEEVHDTVTIKADTSCCIEEVEFYVRVNGSDDTYLGTEFTPKPSGYYECEWNTVDPIYEDQQCTITIKGYYDGDIMCTDSITVTVNNIYVRITNPQEGEVSGTITITADTRGIEEVQFYFDDYCIGGDDQPPFECSWDTTQYPNGSHQITAKGYVSKMLIDWDTVECTVSNESALIFLGMFCAAGIILKRH